LRAEMTSRVESCLLIAITAVSLLSRRQIEIEDWGEGTADCIVLNWEVRGGVGKHTKAHEQCKMGARVAKHLSPFLMSPTSPTRPGWSWFYDRDTDVCLAFKYNGCGGNANRFPTATDSGSCALNKEPAVDRNGQSIICSGPEKNKCPTGYRCKRLAFMGVCCPTKEEERFSKDYEGACSVGQTVKNDRGGWMATLLGKSCADDFCPNGSTCEQGEIFAHCYDSTSFWYYDNETCVCLAFKYNGCGGNSNRFNDFESCTLTCLPLVDGFCSLHKPPAKNNKGEPLLCSDERKQIQKCPEDYICKPVVFVGACCPKASEELYERSVHPKCAIGSIVKTARSESNLLGKSCVDEFCPANSRCVQEELTAFCCQ
uniref:Kunitz/Bovine pancreatic trypsin inhibitor domain protein n=1 Tax=Toxocara canis TaxID=6265 RepID=A0A183UV56_TOXCA